MFSNDKNIEHIADFVEEAKQWLTIRKEYTKIDIIDKVVQICTALILFIVLFILVIMTLIYLSFAAAYALEPITGSLPIGFLIVSAFYLLLLLLIYCKRHKWIERPLVRFLVNILLSDNTHTEE
ncbi:MAG: phage holin family protein [Prevotella sp.]|jgi:hypothetical protein|nr:phage holin family protein [Prevotella sp.]